MAEYPITNICQINQSWKQHDSKDSDVAQDSGLLERDSVTGSNNSAQSEYTAGPLMKNAQYCCETTVTTNPPTVSHHRTRESSVQHLHLVPCITQNCWHTCQATWLYVDDMCHISKAYKMQISHHDL